MNPVAVLGLLLILVAFAWIKASGAEKVGSVMRRNARKAGGVSLIALAGVMAVRGLWEPALLPAAIGWWLVRDGRMGRIGLLLKLYLDRRFPGWRQHAETDAHARSTGAAVSGIMSEQDAYQILGLEPGQSREAIRAAYRAAMKKVHPDQGGATDVAVRLNQARDRLLGSQK